jgi:multidrug efflux pump subunit AcrB
MIAKIIEYSARNRFVVFLAMFLAIAWGYWALKNTPLDAIPDLSDTQVIIYTEWAGRSPDLVEDQITYPITSTLLAAPKVQAVRGFSYLGSSFIYVIFEEGTDIYWARNISRPSRTRFPLTSILFWDPTQRVSAGDSLMPSSMRLAGMTFPSSAPSRITTSSWRWKAYPAFPRWQASAAS